jgi:hypothetical protein
LIGENVLQQNEDNTWQMTPTKSAGEFWGWCSSERFSDQPIASAADVFCSGFLISSKPGWIGTAAHCTSRPLDHYWIIFNFQQTSSSHTTLIFPANDVGLILHLVCSRIFMPFL